MLGIRKILIFPLSLFDVLRKIRFSWVWRTLSVVFIVVALFAALLGTDIGRQAGKNAISGAVFSLGADLPKDEHGLTNILLLGVGGGEFHADKGHKLTDSMMVVSLDIAGRSAVLLSVPRDLYVETPYVRGRINEILRDESLVHFREIKKQPEHAEALQHLSGEAKQEYIWKLEGEADAIATESLRKEIEEILNIDIQRTARIDFKGFIDIVDAIGGIDIFVEKPISDPTYPDFGWGYNPFTISVGAQTLDGETALKYARSRHGSSDFDRALRQQNVINAVKEKMISLDVLTSPARLQGIFSVIQENFVSDISWDEIITLAKFGSQLPRERMVSHVLNDDPSQPGGFLVTPDRSLYGGAFVLVPFLNMTPDKYAQIRAFARTIFFNRSAAGIDPISLVLFNGTKKSGVASTLRTGLERYGWRVSDVDNAAESIIKTQIRYSDDPKSTALAKLLLGYFSAELVPVPIQATEEGVLPDPFIHVFIGDDFSGVYRIPDFSESL